LVDFLGLLAEKHGLRVELIIDIDGFIFLFLDYFKRIFVLVSCRILSFWLTGLAMACLL